MNKQHLRTRRGPSRSGSALVPVLIVVSVVAALAGAALTFNVSAQREVQTSQQARRALYLAEAAVSESVQMLNIALNTGSEVPAAVGSETLPRRLKGGVYWADLRNNGDGSITITGTGRAERASRTIETVVEARGAGVFGNAIFAGNSSNDPTYTLKVGGTGANADLIDGSIYSGGDITVTGDAVVTGDVAAAGTITGTPGESGVSQSIPDLRAMNYEVNHDFDVAGLFAGATWESDEAGGSAFQVPEDNPAHIFRKNPDDRASEVSGTAKDDYFLEDPYEPVGADATSDGSDAYPITLTGLAGDPGPSGTDKVYFIDGNLWIHSISTFSFKFAHDAGENVRVTFVVKGNIIVSDNIFYEDAATDGVAFIAMEDAAVRDSGNIYFGDPRGGTLEHMDAFMYAENDFVDYHLDATGSREVTLNGNMTAGNRVAIERDYDDNGTPVHSRLQVDFDDRLVSRALDLPGLPTSSVSLSAYEVVFWREVAGL